MLVEQVRGQSFPCKFISKDDSVKIVGFIWLENVVEKLEIRHNVFPEEVEEAFANKPKIKRMNRGHTLPEDFGTIEEFWGFWDTHSSADYEDVMEAVEVESD